MHCKLQGKLDPSLWRKKIEDQENWFLYIFYSQKEMQMKRLIESHRPVVQFVYVVVVKYLYIIQIAGKKIVFIVFFCLFTPIFPKFFLSDEKLNNFNLRIIACFVLAWISLYKHWKVCRWIGKGDEKRLNFQLVSRQWRRQRHIISSQQRKEFKTFEDTHKVWPISATIMSQTLHRKKRSFRMIQGQKDSPTLHDVLTFSVLKNYWEV